MKKQELLETGIRITLTVMFFHRCVLVYTRWSLKRVQTFQKSEPVTGDEPIPALTFIYYKKLLPTNGVRPRNLTEIIRGASLLNNGKVINLMENSTAYCSDYYREDLKHYYLTLQLPKSYQVKTNQPSIDIAFYIRPGHPYFHIRAHPPNHVWYGNEDIHGVHRKVTILNEVLPGDHFVFSYSYQYIRSIQMEEQTGCDRNGGRALEKCVRTYVQNKLGCEILQVDREQSYNENPDKYCTKEQEANVSIIMNEIKAPGVNQHFVVGTDCAMNCDTYMPRLTKEYQKLDRMGWLIKYDGNLAILNVKIFTTQLTIPVEETVYMYDDMDAMADVGGFLGLLLGASCLSMTTAAIRRGRELLPIK